MEVVEEIGEPRFARGLGVKGGPFQENGPSSTPQLS